MLAGAPLGDLGALKNPECMAPLQCAVSDALAATATPPTATSPSAVVVLLLSPSSTRTQHNYAPHSPP